MTGAHAATVAGIAVVALGLGYGGAQLSGDGGEKQPAAPAKTSAPALPSVAEAPRAKVVSLGAAPALPGPAKKARPKRTPEPDGPSSTPTPVPSAAPTAAPTSAPTAAPTPVRTPDEGTIG
jgi:hypothetical protein